MPTRLGGSMLATIPIRKHAGHAIRRVLVRIRARRSRPTTDLPDEFVLLWAAVQSPRCVPAGPAWAAASRPRAV